MSKHDLKGIDTGKIGGNKYVNYTFEDYMKDFDLSRQGAIRDLETKNVFLTDLEPIAPKVKQPKNILERVDQLLLGYNQPTEIVGGKVVGKNRPTGLDRFTMGIMPYELLGFTDFDQRGNLFGKNELSGYGGVPTNYELPKSLKESLALQDKAKKEKESKDPLDNIDKILKAEKDYQKAMAPFNRKQRVFDAGLEFLNYALTSPKIFKDLRRETDYAVRRGLQAELRRQSMPDAEQARMLAGSTGFATEAAAMAKQQEAATELAKAGIRPSTATFSA